MKSFVLTGAMLLSLSAFAQDMSHVEVATGNMSVEADASLDELNPFAADIDAQLAAMDEAYERATGVSAHLEEILAGDDEDKAEGCTRNTCKVFLDVNKSTQRATIYVDGVARHTGIRVSTGTASHPTPNFDTHPDGRIFDRHTSGTYPGGDYNGLGNMPYAVFIHRGFAVHGTARSNWPKLGTRASHGCVRMHPDNGRIFNRLVRSVGVAQTWISIHN